MNSYESTIRQIRSEASNAQKYIDDLVSDAVDSVSDQSEDIKNRSAKQIRKARKHVRKNPVAYAVGAGIVVVAIASLTTLWLNYKDE